MVNRGILGDVAPLQRASRAILQPTKRMDSLDETSIEEMDVSIRVTFSDTTQTTKRKTRYPETEYRTYRHDVGRLRVIPFYLGT